MSGGEGELDEINQDTCHVGLVIRHWQELICELGRDTTIGSIIFLFVLTIKPTVPIDICYIILVTRCIAAV